MNSIYLILCRVFAQLSWLVLDHLPRVHTCHVYQVLVMSTPGPAVQPTCNWSLQLCYEQSRRALLEHTTPCIYSISRINIWYIQSLYKLQFSQINLKYVSLQIWYGMVWYGMAVTSNPSWSRSFLLDFSWLNKSETHIVTYCQRPGQHLVHNMI